MRADSSIQWSTYPALLLAGAFAVGIGVDAVARIESVLVWSGGAGLGTGLYLGMEWWARRRMVTLASLGRVLAVALVAVCVGGARRASYVSPSPRSLQRVMEAVGDRPVTVVGTVADAPDRGTSSTRFTLSVENFRRDDSTTVMRGKVRVTLAPSPWGESSGSFPYVKEGDRLRIRGSVEEPPSQRNPGGFDYAAYLKRRGICCTAYVGAPENVALQSRTSSPFTEMVVAGREYVRTSIQRYVPGSEGQAVLEALLLGDRSRISDERRRQFARTGLMHLLAVSGLHVFLVGMVFYVLLRPLLLRLRVSWRTMEGGRAVLTAVLLGFYMMLTGARPSVVRAVVMSILLIGGVLFQRSAHPLNTLGVAAVILLAVRPPALFDAGFQLSMAAVAAIVTINPRLRDWVPERWTRSSGADWVVSTVTASAAATIGTAPVLLYHFGWVSVAGLVLNIVGIPCTGLALSASIAMISVGGISGAMGAAFGSTADVFVRGLLLTSQQGTAWGSWAGIRMAEPSLWIIGALVCGAVALAQWPRPRLRWRSVACGLALVVVGVWGQALGSEGEATLDLLYFDVGQGDAVLVTTPDDRRILVDTGPKSPHTESKASSVILPFLRQRGIGHLHTVVVTHPDEDHLGGLPALLETVSVGRVVHSGQRVDTDLFQESQRLLARIGVTEQLGKRGDTLDLGPSVRAEILGPPAAPEAHGIETENGRSVVMRLIYGEVDVLLPGDVEAASERDLVKTYGGELGSRIVKVPHHGSKTSSTPAFVKATVGATENAHAVVSVGASNPFGMPDPDVLDRWKKYGAKVHSTADGGAVWLRTDGYRVWRVRWRR